MGYEESVIIPLELYKNDCTKVQKNEAEKILKRDDIPTDIKIKLFDQARWRKTNKVKKEAKEKEDRTLPSDAIEQIPIAVQPFVRNIVQQYMNKHRSAIDWDPQTFELIINGEHQPGSNIIRSFQNIMRGKEDILKEKLLVIGVPREWLSQKIFENKTPLYKTNFDWSPAAKEQFLTTPLSWDRRDKSEEEEQPISWDSGSKTSLKTESDTTKIRRSKRPIRKPKWITYY